jgi:hypothetical protein
MIWQLHLHTMLCCGLYDETDLTTSDELKILRHIFCFLGVWAVRHRSLFEGHTIVDDLLGDWRILVIFGQSTVEASFIWFLLSIWGFNRFLLKDHTLEDTFWDFKSTGVFQHGCLWAPPAHMGVSLTMILI